MLTSVNNTFETTGATASTSYTFNYPIHKSTDLKVYVDGVLKTTSDSTYAHTVTVAANKQSASVAFTSASSVDAKPLKFERIVEYKQETDLANNSLLDAESLETSLDNIVMQTQQLVRGASESAFSFDAGIAAADYHTTVTNASTLNKTKAERLNKALAFDGNGDLTVSAEDIDAQIAATASSATAAASSATAAAGSATAAAGSATSASNSLTSLQGLYRGASTSTPGSPADGHLWFDTNTGVDLMKVYNSTGTAWEQLTPSSSNQTKINSVVANETNVNKVAAIDSDVTSVANIDSNVTTVAGIASNVTAVAGDATDIGLVAGKATEIGLLGTSAMATASTGHLALLGTSAMAHASTGHIKKVADIDSNVTTVSGISANVTTVAGISSDVTAVAADATDIGAVAAKATEIGLLGTADAVADMALLGTSACVADMAILGTADVVADLNTLGTADVVTDLNTLGTADVVSDMNTLGTGANVTNMNTLAGIASNITTVAGISSNVSTVAGISANVTTVATNEANVNRYADEYTIASSAPGSPSEGDLWYDSTNNVLKFYNGSSFAQLSTPTFNDLVDDTTPQLGGNLDANGKIITGCPGIVPVGGIVAVHSGMTGAPTLPSTGAVSDGWMLCDGGTIPASQTLSGTTPVLNDARFLQGNTHANIGGTGGDTIPGHTHTGPSHSHGINSHSHNFNANSGGHSHGRNTGNQYIFVGSGSQGLHNSPPTACNSSDNTGSGSGSFNANTGGASGGNINADGTQATGDGTAHSAVSGSAVLPKYLRVVYLIRVI